MTGLIDAQALERLLPMEAAIDALEVGFDVGSIPETPLRSHTETAAGSLILMPGAGPQGVGVKVVTWTAANAGRGLPLINGVYVLFDGDTQIPLAVIDGAALTALRTGAVSGLATRYLAKPEASSLVLFGAGVQARVHLDAMRAVRALERVVVVSRTRARADELAASARELGLEASVGASDAVAEADLVCTCTTSETPLFDGSMLAEGAHVNAVGAYQPHTRELDDEAVRRARVVVETREVAMEEAGDLLLPMDRGVIGRDHVIADLSELVRGAHVRRSASDVTVFESVGFAYEDLVVARAVADRLASA